VAISISAQKCPGRAKDSLLVSIYLCEFALAQAELPPLRAVRAMGTDEGSGVSQASAPASRLEVRAPIT
jgi:hypothetical protein